MSYILNLLIATDQWFNTVLGGSPDETISARAYRSEQKDRILGKLFRPVIDALFYLVETNHCYKAYRAELRRSQLPQDYDGRISTN